MLDVGLSLALPTCQCVCWVGWDAFELQHLVRKMQLRLLDDAPCWSDARTFDGLPWRGVVDIVIAGYPCQPFSDAGKRLGEDDPRHLWPHVARIVSEIAPPLCLFENVPGHVSLGLDIVYRDLRRLGYRFEAGLYAAEEVGASHRRKRFFGLAYAEYLTRGTERRPQPRRRQKGGEKQKPVPGGSCGDRDGTGLEDAKGKPRRLGEQGRAQDRHAHGRVEEVADSSCRRRQRHKGDGSRKPEPQSDVDAVADSRRCAAQRWGEPDIVPRQAAPARAEGKPDAGGDSLGGLFADLGDAEAVGLEAGGFAGRAPAQLSGPGFACDSVVDAEQWRRQPRTPGRRWQESPAVGHAGTALPLFAPGPTDLGSWRRVLDLDPTLEPSLCVSADGVAPILDSRGDQLRMCGNGVFPVGSALAFLSLFARAFEVCE